MIDKVDLHTSTVGPLTDRLSSVRIHEPEKLHSNDHFQRSIIRETTVPCASSGCDEQQDSLSPIDMAAPSSTAEATHQEEPVEEQLKMTLRNPKRNFMRVSLSCIWFLMLGMNDGVLGALLPHIESHYNISYAIVSLIWLGNATGFILIAFTAHIIDEKLGMSKMVTMSCALMVVEFALVGSGTRFPVVVVGFFFGGLGAAIGLSQLNLFLTRLESGEKYLGLCHGVYGLGACLAPIIGTAMVNAGVEWNFFYFVLLGIAVIAAVTLTIAYQDIEKDLDYWDNIEKQAQGEDHVVHVSRDPETLESIELRELHNEDLPTRESKHDFKATLQDYRSWAICIFIFFYQGAEVSMGGWMVTFLLNYRGGDEYATGYVASGYWAGIAVGRFFLTHKLMSTFGCRRTLIVASICIMGLDVMAWLIPNNIASAVCASLVGVAIGPIYTMAVSLATRILPRKIRLCALTLVTAFGSSGGAAVPFTVGMASRFVGTYVLHPVFLTCLGVMLVSWLTLPNIERKGAINNIFQRIW
ncbi:Bypass of stop codon protein 6 [Cyberlindnera fabianii]|uniref:Bypass of stop codon protein 6 n=1 Tax=Cyberlindnera fabianii TaxID=36022 RepID=A0A1V2L953_CYBFA|nr:Bypass of stop codon protein 6 [Cyberlindnera fabianii]